MRIVAGKAKGRPLKAPRDARTIRPTADRVRETLFNVLGQWLDGLAVLDLYAGTGALAFEALSRGASSAVLVDQDKEALSLCRANAEALGFLPQARILASPVDRAISRLSSEGARFDLVFADPPYAERAIGKVLEQLSLTGLLAPDGRVCLEHDRREEAPAAVGGLARVDERRFGDTLVTIYGPVGA